MSDAQWHFPVDTDGLAPRWSRGYNMSMINAPPWGFSITTDDNSTQSPQHYSVNYWPDFRCERCVHYEGGCQCDLNIYIAVSGADMSACWGFKEGITCRHCGKRT